MPLMRLAYASEATFEDKPVNQGVEPHVARILLTSRRNNARSHLVGGLYYGDGRFFQYLEGEESDVLETFERIKQDERHRNIFTLMQGPLETPTFTSWSMKYVPLSSDVRRFLERNGLQIFNPSEFTESQCEEMIELIRQSSHDQKLVNHDEESGAATSRPQAFSPGLRFGLMAAGIALLGALIYAGSLL
ncbi:BLUF domain-containing protein [Marinobacter koreensis]|uniref:BLUF domain-containing protein n=1 Tax=Marinobacter koreensis TaxID=335974 RepID=A0ABW0RKV2_9GAMM|nr:BLUF domain-containing protein [Marinobacter koreensis]MCK7546843.1 BLUF domain-containing protein [Marinobacter koreensis]